jgi:hypothetical protein
LYQVCGFAEEKIASDWKNLLVRLSLWPELRAESSATPGDSFD